ncbi:coiled-coil domain-containing protein 102A-like protein [Gossypium australe]|uniref:Coiled-coil domain-containing protein 102A-like protein n=1 Tax=Gossypium australe TaxID=47621 RepID=A0A5B6VF81_9ROSI|nr:coiled-coil domain-containing protein 102A-like protein [Gossypium australe]
MQLRLDVDVQKLEAEKLRKGKNKAEEDLDKIKEENNRADQWKKKFQDARVREDALKRDLIESQNKKVGMKARVAELEKSLHQYCTRNSAIELKVSLNKIEELKGKIRELEAALQNCELRVELLETNNEHWKEQLQRSQCQIKDKDYIMGEAVSQVREVADHLQTLAVQADMLSLKYESEGIEVQN